MSSCSSILDKSPDGKISLNDIFNDNDRTAAWLNTCYGQRPQLNNTYWFWSRGPANWSDDAWDADEWDVDWAASSRLYRGDASASNFPIFNNTDQGNNNKFWTRYWPRIHDCAYFIDNIATASVDDETDRSRWTAEAHLLRAYYYSHLLRWYGTGLPLVEHAYNYTDDFSKVKKASYYETVKFIIADCDAAIACPELPMRITNSSENGRLPKALAYAIRSRYMMYAASPLYCEGEDHWQEAYNYAKEAVDVLRDNGFKLYDELQQPNTYTGQVSFFGPTSGYLSKYKRAAGLYSEYFVNSQAVSPNPADMETIYQSFSGGGNGQVEGIGAGGQYKTGTCPSQELVDAFETIDGQPILNLDKPYNDPVTHLEPNFNQDNRYVKNGSYERNPYNNRDPRFYASIYYNGSRRYEWWPFKETKDSPENFPASEGMRTRRIMTYVGEPQTGTSVKGRYMTRTSYFIRKFWAPTTDGCGHNMMWTAPSKEYRFAEMLLNLAECAYHIGREAEARELVNEVRARVEMPALPESLTGEALLLRIKNERRVEFCFEEQRLFDVRRWHNPNEDLETTDRWITRMTITRQPNGTFTYKREPASFERQCWENKWLKYPLPLTEVNKMIAISGENWQNPGW